MKKTHFITYSAFCAALITLCSWISIPIGAVPVTLQVLGIVLVALLFGEKIGFTSTLLWIMLGLVGVPVFSGFSGGLSVLMGPTAGYIWAFLPSAYLIGKAGENSTKAGVMVALACLFLLVYPLGTWHLMRVTGMDIKAALAVAVYPFVAFDVIKIGLAFLAKTALMRSGLTKMV